MFLRKVAHRTAFIGWFLALFVAANVPTAQAATDILFNSAPGNVCDTTYSANAMHGNRYVARTSLYITNIDAYIGTGSQTNFSTSRFVLMSDNPSTNLPATVLRTFTPTTITGSGMSTLARYSGSYAISAGTKFWIVNAQGASTFPWCYIYGASATSFTMNGMTVDTSTSLSNTSYRRAYITPATNPATANWASVDDGFQWQLLISSTGFPSVVATISTQSGSLNAIYRSSTPLSVSVNTDSLVTFYANQKVIAGCRNILSSSGVSSCNWNPTVHGSFRIYAVAKPVSTSYVASTTSAINIGVAARSNNR